MRILLLVADCAGESFDVCDWDDGVPIDRWDFTAKATAALRSRPDTGEDYTHIAYSNGMVKLLDGWECAPVELLGDPNVWAASVPASLGELSPDLVMMEADTARKFTLNGAVKAYGWERILAFEILANGGKCVSVDSELVVPLVHEERDFQIGEKYYDMISDMRIVDGLKT